ncbi:MAG: non-hydrolyzing UDP-N-acetylglucosamine 2-epimerase [Nitrospiria bacterium]
MKLRILIVFGTRPEAIKLAPLIKKIKEIDRFELKICSTGQHKQMLEQVLKTFFITLDYSLDIMKRSQDLFGVTSEALLGLKKIIEKESPGVLVVQGDTTTALIATIAAFYCKVKVAHVEAGLRTGDKYNPFPEEINRKLISAISDIHFAPTEVARENLLREGIEEAKIFVTGNTVVDALNLITEKWKKGDTRNIEGMITYLDSIVGRGQKILIVTCHRRESFGEDLENICRAIKIVALQFPEVVIVFPVHLNPNVRNTVYRILQGITNVHLLDALDYESFLWLLNKSYFIVTDSGGIQEEAPSFKKPVLVIRKKTERPEGIRHGITRLTGTSSREISSHISEILKERVSYEELIPKENPYGDGKASDRIIKVLKKIK